MFRIALHYICPYQVMEISIGDFGAFRDGLEAKRGDSREGDALIKCPSGIRKSQRPFGPSRSRCQRCETEKYGSGLTQWCTEAAVDAREMKTQEMETKCGSGLTQRCDETAGKIPHSLPRSYLSHRCDDEARKPLQVSQRLGGAVSRGRCESRKSTFSVFDKIITNLCFG